MRSGPTSRRSAYFRYRQQVACVPWRRVISEHVNRDRSPLSGYAVTFVAFENDQPVGTPKRVVTGFVSDDEKQLRGAPVGLTQDRDGALIIADDAGNTVWRVTKSGN